MPPISKRVWICAPSDSVWAVVADFGHVEFWAPTVTKCFGTSTLRRGVGAERTLTTTNGRQVEEIVVEWNEGRDFTFQIPNGIGSIAILEEMWSVQRWPQGSEVVVTIVYDLKPGIIHKLVESLLLRRALTNILIRNLAGLKHHVETGERVTPKTPRLPISAVS